MFMNSAQTIRAKLRKLDATYWTDYRIAQHLDVSQSQLKQLLTETKNPSGKTVIALIALATEHAKISFEDAYSMIESDLEALPKIERRKKKLE